MLALSWILGLLPLAVLFGAFFGTERLYKNFAKTRAAPAALVVLAGILAAIAIPIPVAASFLPEKNYGPRAWFLVGALAAAIISACLLVYSMIKLQDKDPFSPKTLWHIPGSINGAWSSLILLALSAATIRFHPGTPEEVKSQGQIFVAHNFLNIGMKRADIEKAWGEPSLENGQQIIYKTQLGTTLFCMDDKDVSVRAIQTKETKEDALTAHCK